MLLTRSCPCATKMQKQNPFCGKHSIQNRRNLGTKGDLPPQILAGHLTLFQPGRLDQARHITIWPTQFLGHPTVLQFFLLPSELVRWDRSWGSRWWRWCRHPEKTWRSSAVDAKVTDPKLQRMIDLWPCPSPIFLIHFLSVLLLLVFADFGC